MARMKTGRGIPKPIRGLGTAVGSRQVSVAATAYVECTPQD